MRQKILTMCTLEPELRCNADGWSCDDGDLVNLTKPIGLTGSPYFTCYETPLHAIGDGWRLLGPPVQIAYLGELKAWQWWFEK